MNHSNAFKKQKARKTKPNRTKTTPVAKSRLITSLYIMPDYVLFTTEVLCDVKQWICKTDAGKEMAVLYVPSVDPVTGYYLHLQLKMSFQVTGTTSPPSSLFKQHNLE